MIKVENLHFTYPKAQSAALKGVTFHIPKGKYVAILGHNGSGKSTLAKLLVALLKPTIGSIYIENIVYSKKNLLEVRSRIGMVFQNPDNQFIGATVEDDIAFGLENKKNTRDEIKDKIYYFAKKVDMIRHLKKEPHKLSGGQKQRVAIAATLALSPKVIIFDEITSMLDPKGKRDVLKILKELRDNPEQTLISVTHDMDEAVLADELIVLYDGQILAQGPPLEIFSNPDIVEKAKIDFPFVYQVSKLYTKNTNLKPTFEYDKLLEQICK
ncbi:MAG: energy-coupling factor transporter ATPase [Mycoplasma sp.]|nr:energy-coupling factor transporter ATPase [Mycoplasma sp.]